MAYREELGVRDVAFCGKLFRTIDSPKRGWGQLSSRNIFEVAHACTALVDDLREEFLERHPQLAKAPFCTVRTRYGKWYDPGEHSVSHQLGWAITKGGWRTWQFLLFLEWSHDPDDAGSVCIKLQENGEDSRVSYLRGTRMFTSGALDRGKLTKALDRCARQWGVI